jgi:hypothetical protein
VADRASNVNVHLSNTALRRRAALA